MCTCQICDFDILKDGLILLPNNYDITSRDIQEHICTSIVQ